ncbi:MAG: DUF4064 domain-containing protein [Micrococcus sp.]|nr:DUF4064 domain-containing protein [Micrococcus sp.]
MSTPTPQNHGGQPGYGAPQESRYGTQAYDPQGGYDVMERPRQYGTLLMATLLSLAVFVISAAYTPFMPRDEQADREAYAEVQAEGIDMTFAEFQNLVMVTTLVVMAVIVLIAIAIYLVVYIGLRKRKNWARILGIVLAILTVVGSLLSLLLGPVLAGMFGADIGVFGYVISGVMAAVNIWWLVLAFNSQVARYVAPRRY